MITIDVLVQPRASRAKIGPRHDGRIKIAVTAPPVDRHSATPFGVAARSGEAGPFDGEANAAVIELVAKSLGVAKSAVEVIAGASSRRKTLWIAGVTEAQIEGLLA